MVNYGYGYAQQIEKEIKRRNKLNIQVPKEWIEVLKPQKTKQYEPKLVKKSYIMAKLFRNETDDFVYLKVKNPVVKLNHNQVRDLITSLEFVSADLLARERKLLGIVYKIEDELGIDRGY